MPFSIVDGERNWSWLLGLYFLVGAVKDLWQQRISVSAQPVADEKVDDSSTQ